MANARTLVDLCTFRLSRMTNTRRSVSRPGALRGGPAGLTFWQGAEAWQGFRERGGQGCGRLSSPRSRSSRHYVRRKGGTAVVDICRKLGSTETTFYRWKKQYTGLDVREIRELKQLRDEDCRLTQVVADLTLDTTMLHEALGK